MIAPRSTATTETGIAGIIHIRLLCWHNRPYMAALSAPATSPKLSRPPVRLHSGHPARAPQHQQSRACPSPAKDVYTIISGETELFQ